MAWVFTWIDPVGEETLLSDPPNLKVRFRQFKGASAPPFTPINEEIPLTPGSYLKFVDTEEAEVDLTLLIQDTSESALWNRLSPLPQTFNPLRGDGLLRVSPPHNMERELVCRCISGFRLNEESLQEKSVEANLHFYANQPYWRSTQEFVITVSLDNPPDWFPIFPLNLGGDAVVSIFDVDNQGEVETYPTWKIQGPGSNPKLTNQTTGKFFSLSSNGGITLDSTEFITIDTENRTVLLDDGTNLMSVLDYGSSFWPLEPGNNSIKVEMAGATTDSSITLSYRHYFLGVI